ncbi:MAG: Ig-like domain-containing protein [Gemmatimonadota bacterium]
MIPWKSPPSRRPALRGALAAALLAAGSCSDATAPGADTAAKVEVRAPATELTSGDSVRLAATVLGASGRELASQAVAWTSSDTSVAAVDSLGWARARRAGSAVVTARSGAAAGELALVVRHLPVASVTVSPDGYTVGTGRTMRLTATLLGTAGDTVRGAVVAWSSSDTARVRVLGDGTVTGVAAGTAVVTASAGGRSGTAAVSVGTPVGRVHVTPAWEQTLPVGSTKQLEVDLRQDGVGPQPQMEGRRQVVWTSSDGRVATVSAAGLVRAVGPGKATVTAASEGVSATVPVTVLGEPVKVVLTPETATLSSGSTALLEMKATDVLGATVLEPTYTVTVSNPAVASVEKPFHYYMGTWRATLAGLAPGSAMVVVRAGTASDTTLVTVVPRVAAVEVLPDTATLQVGASRQFRAVARDPEGNVLTGRAVAWSSTHLGAAAIDAAGLATAVGPGATTIVATVEGRTGTARVTVPGAVSAAGSWKSVAAGDGHTCALDAAGRAFCWGRNHLGQLGSGSAPDSSSRPAAVTGGLAFTELSAASYGVCGVASSGDAYCWGSWTGYAQVVPAPRAVAAGRKFSSVHAGGTYGQACGLETAGSIYCWGFWNSPGWVESAQPGPFRAVIASAPCGLTPGGVVACWSQRVSMSPNPLGPAPAAPLVGLSGGELAACAWTAAGEAHCTTAYYRGVGGSGGFAGLAPLPGGIRFTQVSVGSDRACGVDEGGRAYCWSVTLMGGGPGYGVRHGTPEPVGGGLRFAQVSAGAGHACGVATEGAAFCWGDNRWGQLGTGVTGGSSTEPSRVREP